VTSQPTIGLRNWAGNHEFSAARLHEPESIEQVQDIVRRAPSLRVLGSRHSFNDIADTPGELLSLGRMPRTVEIDPAERSVTVDGGIRYGELCDVLEGAGLALHNLASLAHISVAGACATATHGSGDRNGNLATAVSAMSIVTANGEIVRIGRDVDSTELDGAVVSLGGLGVVVSLTLDIQPTYRVRQDVYENLPLAELERHFDELTSSADSVSFFTDWRGPTIDQVWLKRRIAGGAPFEPPARLFGATRATAAVHPIPAISPDACTAQMGLPGPWHERLPHFRLDHTPSSGDELQSEFLVPREHAIDALESIYGVRDRIAPLIQISEIRTIAADGLWMSPSFGRASVALHFTWQPDWAAVRVALPVVEKALEPFDARPHWGKLFTMPADEVRLRYPRLPDFVELLRHHDPTGTFRNGFLDRYVFGEPRAGSYETGGDA
jgi:xylitol oxidase